MNREKITCQRIGERNLLEGEQEWSEQKIEQIKKKKMIKREDKCIVPGRNSTIRGRKKRTECRRKEKMKRKNADVKSDRDKEK